jgi:hypothetical protein
MRLIKLYLFGVWGLGFGVMRPLKVCAQSEKPLKIAVFAPVYLDSVFTEGNYKLGNAYLPRQVLPGLDFYNGMMMAIDSLNTTHTPISVLFYDSKSATMPLQTVVSNPELQDVSLIIASFNSRTDIKPLADLALQLNVPLISSTYPNDGGITGNPFFVLINPTLKTHIEAIYHYLHRVYPLENMVLFRKKGGIEDLIQYVLGDMNRKTAGVPLKIKTVELTDSFSVRDVTDNLDSTKQNIVICGTLNEEFGSSLSKALGSSRNFHTITMGMPTWDGIKDISKDIEIIYTTPYNFLKNDKLMIELNAKYRAKYAGRPGDMFFKGYEAMFHFSKLLVKNKSNLINTLSDKDFKLFNDFDIQPVKSNKESSQPDYLENKKLYFIRKADGVVKSVN